MYQPTEDLKNGTLMSFSIAWLFPHANLALDPSNRLRRYQISNYLNNLTGIVTQSKNFFFYGKKENLKEELLNFDVIVFFNINELDLQLMSFLNEQGKITIFDHAENIFGLGHEDAIMRAVTAITCCSNNLAQRTYNYLVETYHIEKPIFVIRDPIEDSALDNHAYPHGDNLALVMGMGANVQYVMPTLERYCVAADYKMMLLTEAGFSYPRHRVEYWTPYSWINHALECSVALCFHNGDQFPAKGNVKVTTPMSLGLPVIACPIDAYTEAISNGNTGFIASHGEDWVRALNLLKNKGFRSLLGMRAKRAAITRYSTEQISLDYLSMIAHLDYPFKGLNNGRYGRLHRT